MSLSPLAAKLEELVAEEEGKHQQHALASIIDLCTEWYNDLVRGCPACGPGAHECDHIAGYVLALDDLEERVRALLPPAQFTALRRQSIRTHSGGPSMRVLR